MFETEGDTLSQTLKSDYGNYSDTLRKAYHHEAVSLCRRKDREFLEVDCPKLSVVLAGTPGQIRNLIPDSENGLFSRFAFYHIRFERGIRNVFAVTDTKQSKTEVFRRLGQQYKELLGKIHREAQLYEVALPPLLQGSFVEHCTRLNNEACDAIGNGMQGVVRRNALTAFRILMVLTMLRHLTDNSYHPVQAGQTLRLECSDEDYRTALSIADTLLYHSAYMYRLLEKVGGTSASICKAEKRETLLALLPDSFTKQEYLAAVRKSGYNESTCTKWLDRYLAENKLRHCGHSQYEKVRVAVSVAAPSSAPSTAYVVEPPSVPP